MKHHFWTNPSVLDFAGGDDPIEAVLARARGVVQPKVYAEQQMDKRMKGAEIE
jgi:hypothetical protein